MACKEALLLSKVRANALIVNMLQPHTNEHTVHGRPVTKDVKHSRTGSLRTLQEINLFFMTIVPGCTQLSTHVVFIKDC